MKNKENYDKFNHKKRVSSTVALSRNPYSWPVEWVTFSVADEEGEETQDR